MDAPMLLFHVEGINDDACKRCNMLIDAEEGRWQKAGICLTKYSNFKSLTIVKADFVEITDQLEMNTIGHEVTKRQFSLLHHCFVTKKQPTGYSNDDWKVDNTKNPRVELIQ